MSPAGGFVPDDLRSRQARYPDRGIPKTADGYGFAASMYLTGSAATHTVNGGNQKVGSGGGTNVWVTEFDYRPYQSPAQVNEASGKLIVQQAGLYLVQYGVAFAATNDGKIVAAIVTRNGVTVAKNSRTTGALDSMEINSSRFIEASVGDEFELYAFQNNSGAHTYSINDPVYNYLQMIYMQPKA